MKSLPEQPNLEFLRREARTLRSQHRAQDNSVCKVIGHFDTSFHGLNQTQLFARKFSILDAQRVTARQYGFASWKRLRFFVLKATELTSDFNAPLREELLRRNVMREALLRRAKHKKADSVRRYREFNYESKAILQNVYEQYGWPGPQIVGRDGVEACFWLGLRDANNSQFQYRSAQLMKDSLPRGECYGVVYAITVDRWLNLSYQPTLFGAFNDFNEESGCVEYTSDVVDSKNLNKRRAEVGLRDFATENQELTQRALDQKWPRHSQSDWKKMKRKWALVGGYISL